MKTNLFNYQIAAIVETLYGEIDTLETSRDVWAFSLYYVIMKSCGNRILEPRWENEYKQWNIAHLYRGALSSKNKQNTIPTCRITNIKKGKSNIKLKGEVESNIGANFEIEIKKSLFKDLYNKTLNKSHLFILESEVEEIINALSEIGLKKNTAAQNSKIECLWKMINELRKVYKESGTEEKEYLETIIGAALFYLPHPVNGCFNGFCSINCNR